MLRYFHRILEPYELRTPFSTKRRISWEVYAEDGKIGFYVVCPTEYKQYITQNVYTAYPGAEILEVEDDYTLKFNPKATFCAELQLHNHFMFTTKLDNTDTPLSSILNCMSGLENKEKMLLQFVLLPINNRWQGEAYRRYREMMFEGKKPLPKSIVRDFSVKTLDGALKAFESVIQTALEAKFDDDNYKNTQLERDEMKNTAHKITRPGFRFVVRLLAGHSDNFRKSVMRLNSIVSSFSVLDGDNEFRRKRVLNRAKFIEQTIERHISPFDNNNKCCITELAPVIRLPNKNIIIPELKQREIRTYEPPEECTKGGILLGEAIHRGEEKKVYLPANRVDDLVHPLIITGASGAGKTTLLINISLGRIEKGYNVIIVDTEGDLSEDFIMRLPDKHLKNTLWLNFGNTQYPIPLDLLERLPISGINADFVKDWAISELINHFRKMYGQNWGPATEWLTRNNLKATLEIGGNFLEVFRMLIDNRFRESVIPQIKDKNPITYSFWKNFQENLSEPQKTKAVMPSINKIGPFIEDRIVRNIVCQGNQPYSFLERLDKAEDGGAKITVITIPKGVLIGTWNLIGGLIISKIWLSALVRSNNVQLDQRHPCFLTIDEVEDLVSHNFPIMLSQSRKRRLGLTFSHQYIAQLDRNTRSAIFGNRPHILAMKPGRDDASFYNELFNGYYTANDLNKLPNYHIVPIINISGSATNPFVVKTKDDIFDRDKKELNNKSKLDYVWEITKEKLGLKPVDEVERIVKEKQAYIMDSLVESIEEDEIDIQHDVEVSESILENLRRAR